MIPAWVILATLFTGQVPADSGTVAISHVTIVDVESGALRPDATVLLRAGRITRIGDARTVPVPKSARPPLTRSSIEMTAAVSAKSVSCSPKCRTSGHWRNRSAAPRPKSPNFSASNS